MEKKVCENCEQSIGNLEQSFMYKGRVVCRACIRRLSEESDNTSYEVVKEKFIQSNSLVGSIDYVHTPVWLIVLAVILCILGVTSFTSVVYKTTLDPLRQISFGFLIWQFLRLFRGSMGVSILVGVLRKKKWTIKTVVVYAITSCLCSAIYATRSLLTKVMASDVPITFPYYMPIVFAFLVVGVFLPGIVVFLFFRKSARAALIR